MLRIFYFHLNIHPRSNQGCQMVEVKMRPFFSLSLQVRTNQIIEFTSTAKIRKYKHSCMSLRSPMLKSYCIHSRCHGNGAARSYCLLLPAEVRIFFLNCAIWDLTKIALLVLRFFKKLLWEFQNYNLHLRKLVKYSILTF
jgi:hypothetical protein